MMDETDDSRTHPKSDTIFKTQWMVNSLQRDLMLFENQLPLFVIVEIWDMSTRKPQSQLANNVFIMFNDIFPSAIGARVPLQQIYIFKGRHILDVFHKSWVTLLEKIGQIRSLVDSGLVLERKTRGFISSTTELQEAGVELKKVEGTFSVFDIKFEGGVMEVPTLTIEDRTETFFRNLIAYEQYRLSNEPSPVTDYMRFLDCLIDTPKDVQILSDLGIIDNWLGDDKVVSTMFNKISEAVAAPINTFQYADIFTRVNDHCSRRRNKWMAVLKRDYFNSPWAGFSVFAAALLLLLTLPQTGFAIFPRN